MYKFKKDKIEENTFVACFGVGDNFEKIDEFMNNLCPSGYKNEKVCFNNNYFAKIGYGVYYDESAKVCCVGGYQEGEMEDVNAFFIAKNGFTYSFTASKIPYELYCKFGEKMLEKLEHFYFHFHFCFVINDRNGNIIAGVTEPNNDYTHLFYGYTKEMKKLMFSNNQDVLKNFCDEIIEMDNYSYMLNGMIYSIDGKETSQLNKKIIDSKEMKMISQKEREMDKKDIKSIDSIMDNLKELLIQVTNDEVRSRVEDIIFNGISSESEKQIISIVKDTIESQNVKENIEEQLFKILDKSLEEYRNKIQIPIVNIIKLKDTVLGQNPSGFYHEKFEKILTQVQLDEPIMLIGPAGSGKNVAVKQVAEALGKPMYYTNNATNEFKLTGFIDAGGNYRETEFYKAFKNGGIFFLDEIDNSDPSSLININSALSNGYMAFPHETIDRHPDFRMIAAANTWGKGADLQYVGRNALDAATLDRFDNIFFDYDRNLEAGLYPNEEVLQFMWAFRDAVLKTKILHVVSTRGIGKVYKKEINGIPVEDTLLSNVIKNLGQDDVNTIIGMMENVDSNNKYYAGIKQLRLMR